MVTENTSGSQTATIDTEHTLATITSGGVFVLAVDLTNLVNGDFVTLRVYVKVRSSDGETKFMHAVFANIQTDKTTFSLPITAPHSVKFTLEQTEGTGRAFPWSVYEL